jgi:tRNA(His) 5'-end guanylyltransferase
MEKDDFGNRMKEYERKYTNTRIPVSDTLCVRIDGKRFSKFTKGFTKPFDYRITDAMSETTAYLVEATNANIGYVQSDEITLIYTPTDGQQEYMYGGKISKINSILASIATAHFNQYINIPRLSPLDRLAYFDCRAWGVPTLGEASNTLLWRIHDCRKNSVSCLYRWTAGHARMKDKSQEEMIEDLEKNYNVCWDDLKYYYKYGTIFKHALVDVETEHGIVSRRKIHTYDPYFFSEVYSFEERVNFINKIERKKDG